MEDVLPSHQAFHLIRLLHETRHATYRVLEKEFKRLGVTPIQVVVLDVIQNSKNPVTSAEISRQISRAHPTIAALVRRMEKKGLVKLIKDLDNRNWIRVVIRKQGLHVYAEAMKKEGFIHLFSCLSQEEQKQLHHYLEKLQNKALTFLKND